MKTGIVTWVTVALLASAAANARTLNGFDVGDASIPVAEILQGGPPKDGIPAIDDPVFVGAKEAGFLSAQDRVIGIARHGIAKAYPIAILNWHEIVNDRIGPEAIVVTYCPLCGTGMVFSAEDELSFGVSGLLYNNNVLMYDRQTESLWSQLKMEAVTGKYQGDELQQLPASHTTLGEWEARFPESLVLSERTGFDRDYSHDPYFVYRHSSDVHFPFSTRERRYHLKELVIGVRIGDEAWAWPFVELARAEGPVTGEVGGQRIEVYFDSEDRTGAVFNEAGEEIASTIAYWFAWISVYPDSQVYQAD